MLVDLGLQAVPSLGTTAPDPTAQWLSAAAFNPAARGCLALRPPELLCR
jgi:hypothetical protein